ncbi:branched-chain amino acid ABC transporter permease [Bacillus sp. JJ1773]|uniref:branched-chain amino acid ABC transporter permease n=1 Tax=Bacillus sp. JJ1773 TaxID=3122965 RepID=UPI002FFF171C
MQKKKLFIGLIFIAVILLPFFINQHLTEAVTTMFYFAYLALCWNLVFGYTGQFSLGHVIFLAIGAYTSSLLFINLGLTPWLGMIVGGIFSAIVGMALSAVVFKYKVGGIYFALLTMAMIEVVRGIVISWEFVGGPVGLMLPIANSFIDFSFDSKIPYYFIAVGLLIMLLLVTYFISRSKFGYFLEAIREDEAAAQATGINTYKYKVLIMGISAFFTAIGGTFYAQMFQFISPDTLLIFDPQLEMMIGTMVGGAGTIFGPVIGAITFGVVQESLRMLPIGSREVIIISKIFYGLILLFIILKLPKGLISLRFSKSKRMPNSSNPGNSITKIGDQEEVMK